MLTLILTLILTLNPNFNPEANPKTNPDTNAKTNLNPNSNPNLQKLSENKLQNIQNTYKITATSSFQSYHLFMPSVLRHRYLSKNLAICTALRMTRRAADSTPCRVRSAEWICLQLEGDWGAKMDYAPDIVCGCYGWYADVAMRICGYATNEMPTFMELCT